MASRRRGLVVPALVAISAVALAVSGALLIRAAIMGDSQDRLNNDTSTAVLSERKTINIIATESSFPFVDRWVSQYNNIQSVTKVIVSYVDNKMIDLRNADLAIISSIEGGNDTLPYIPVAPRAMSIVYNIPGFPDVPSGLKLNSSSLSMIFNGSITRWNDTAITSVNPELSLPSGRIAVVHEFSDSDLRSLSKYLSISDGKIRWTNDSIGVSGPDELAATVRRTPYSIGYVDFSYAVQTKMTFAELANRDGEYVAPSSDSIDKALTNALQNGTFSGERIVPPAVNSSRLVNGSYPLVGLYYALPALNGSNQDAVVDFIRWITSETGGQQSLSEVQYPALYRNGTTMSMYVQEVLANRTAN